MKIPYKRTETDTKPQFHLEGNAEPCCDQMRSALDDDLIGFDGNAESPGSMLSIIDGTQYYGDIQEEYCPISFCPFCGKKIEPVMVKHVRRVKTVTHTERTVRDAHTTTREDPISDT